jgi:hypothetical protein
VVLHTQGGSRMTCSWQALRRAARRCQGGRAQGSLIPRQLCWPRRGACWTLWSDVEPRACVCVLGWSLAGVAAGHAGVLHNHEDAEHATPRWWP